MSSLALRRQLETLRSTGSWDSILAWIREFDCVAASELSRADPHKSRLALKGGFCLTNPQSGDLVPMFRKLPELLS